MQFALGQKHKEGKKNFTSCAITPLSRRLRLPAVVCWFRGRESKMWHSCLILFALLVYRAGGGTRVWVSVVLCGHSVIRAVRLELA